MFNRLVNPLKSNSFFLFGARGTGKTTLVKALFQGQGATFIDLLSQDVLGSLQAYPERLRGMAMPAIEQGRWVLIDEVQKVPALLDVVHALIEEHRAKFVLTGSSARKLRRGAANLLAGRAFTYRLFPLVPAELEDAFDLDAALRWGTLPKLFELTSDQARYRYLQTYVETYLQEEIIAEQVVRKLPPFRRFLEVAAQSNSAVINYSAIASDIDADAVSVKNYFQILEDTLIGFFLEPFAYSARKRQRKSPKFYLFDTGVIRAQSLQLDVPVKAGNWHYGQMFETFVINTVRASLEYAGKQYRMSYLLTKDHAEIDLIVERGAEKTLLIEIKSGASVRSESFNNLRRLAADIPNAHPLCIYAGKSPLVLGGINVLPWQQALDDHFAVEPDKP